MSFLFYDKNKLEDERSFSHYLKRIAKLFLTMLLSKGYLLYSSCLCVRCPFRPKDPKSFHVKSPDGRIVVSIDAGSKIAWSVIDQSNVIITPSGMSLTLDNGEVLGDHPHIISAKTATVNTIINTPFYKKKSIIDNYSELTLQCEGDYGIIVRAYNDGAAYRFFTRKKDEITIHSEEANFNFESDYNCFIAHVKDFRGSDNTFNHSNRYILNLPFQK